MSLTQVSVCSPHGGDFLGNFHFCGKMGVLEARGRGLPRGAGVIFLGRQVRQRRAEQSPAPTEESRNSVKNSTHSLAAYCRGGALLHPGGL